MKDERTELRERRTASTKTYENPDHSFTKEIYLSPVHYQTEDGSWEEMDDTLADVETPSETENAAKKVQKKVADASAFINRKGRWQASFAPYADVASVVTVKDRKNRILP